MYRFSTYKRQYKANLKLALPVVMTQLGQILVQVADNVMVGRYGGDDPTPKVLLDFWSALMSSSSSSSPASASHWASRP